MTLDNSHIDALQQADMLVRETKALYDNARLVREREIRRVAAEGGTYREMSKVAGVTYQRVAQIVTGGEPPSREWNDWLKVECPVCGAGVGEECVEAKGYAHGRRHSEAYYLFIGEHPELA